MVEPLVDGNGRGSKGSISGTSDSEWAAKIAKKIRRMSPMSLAITHEQIKRGADMDLYDIFSMEYNLGEFQFFEDISFS